MKPQDYVDNVLITEARDFSPVIDRLSVLRNVRLVHASAGISSEIAELFELSNKSWNGRDAVIDRTNLLEELGDILWYVGIATDALNSVEYVTTESDFKCKKIEFDDDLNDSLFNSAARLSEISGEFADLAIKKLIFYGKPFNAEPLNGLLSQIHQVVAILLQEAGFTIEQARERNIAKLKKRYGDKFSEAAALNRNLEAERTVLENK